MRKLRATGGTHRDGALPASAVKVGVLGALATATIAAPLAAAAAGVEEGAELPQAAGSASAGSASAAAELPLQAVSLPTAQLDEASAETADAAEVEARESDSGANREQQRTSPAADQKDADQKDAAETADAEASEGAGIEVEAPEPEVLDEDGDALAQTDGGYLQPVNAPITSGYGYRTHPVLGSGKAHEGIDFGAACGTPVHSAQSGTVIATETTSASGNRVKVDHGNGVVTGYYHLQGFATSQGATVEAGEVIGYVGTTGRSTGCHLHFAKLDEAGNYSDPMSILR